MKIFTSILIVVGLILVVVGFLADPSAQPAYNAWGGTFLLAGIAFIGFCLSDHRATKNKEGLFWEVFDSLFHEEFLDEVHELSCQIEIAEAIKDPQAKFHEIFYTAWAKLYKNKIFYASYKQACLAVDEFRSMEDVSLAAKSRMWKPAWDVYANRHPVLDSPDEFTEET